MTKEEIIKGLCEISVCQIWEDEVIDEAIKALAQDCVGSTQKSVGSTQKSVGNALDMRCDDAISRDAVLKIIDGWYDNNREVENIEDLIILITYMQAVQPKRQGHREYNDIYDHYLCSKCKTIVADYDNFCPNCGADMRGAE